MNEITVQHSTSTGHRIVGHEGGLGKCARLHGHTYTFRVWLTGEDLDETGFVVDFGDVKRVLDEWDHRIVLWDKDEFTVAIAHKNLGLSRTFDDVSGVVRVPFNPTAENMARHLSKRMLALSDRIASAKVMVHETPKTSAVYTARREE
jgi:6-pyruvoyltetrahydropterin/6-carboxytetrahydropterin synthase